MAGLKSILREEKEIGRAYGKKYLPNEKFTGGNLEGIG